MEYVKRYLYPYYEDWYLNNDFFVPNLDEKLVFYNRETTTLQKSLDKNNILMIVGERQSGKTTYIKHYWNTINTHKKFWFDLNNYLEAELQLENVYSKIAQESNQETSYIFIDNLNNISQRFLNNFFSLLKKCDIDNIKIIFTSNIFNIPFNIISTIKNIFKIENDASIIYKLTPFSYEDIATYINNDFKFKKLLLYKFNFFLTNNQTLNEINNILTTDFCQKDVFEYLIKVSILKSKMESQKQTRNLTLSQILYILGYVAYNQVKYNKLGLSFQLEYNNIENLSIHKINIGREIFYNEIINLSEIDFENLLSCNLFFKENNLYKFKSYDIRDYLIAYYLYNKSIFSNNFNYQEVIEINEYIVPIFGEVASWLSILDEKYYNKSIEKNSHIFLKSNILYNSEQNKTLIEKAIELLYDEKITYYDIKSGKLIYPGLSKQIKHILNNKNKLNSEIILFCINLIEYGRLLDFQKWLFEQIKNNDNDIGIRSNALRALKMIGNHYWKNRICRLYDEFILELSNTDFDKRDNFRGALLDFYINTSMPTKKIIQLITPEKKENYAGHYAYVLHNIIDNYIDESNITKFLKLIDINKLDILDYHFKHFYENIINKSLEYINNEKILKIVSILIYKHLQNSYYCSYLDIENLKVKNEITKNLFVYITTNLISYKNFKHYDIHCLYDKFMNYEDFLWLCELYKKENVPSRKKKFKNLIFFIKNNIFPSKLYENTKEYFSHIYKQFNNDTLLVKDFGKFNTYIYKQKMTSWTKRQLKNKKNIVNFDSIKYIEENYEKVKNDHRYANKLITYLTLSDSNKIGRLSFITENYPTWIKSNNELQNRILNTFYEYLKNETPPEINEKYIKGNSFQPVWFSLVFVEEMINRKLILVKDAKTIAEKWTLYILLLPNFDNDDRALQNTIENFYKIIPYVLIKTLKNFIKLTKDERYPHILKGFENIYNDELNNILLDLLKTKNNLSIEYKLHILEYLKLRLPKQCEKFVCRLFKNSSTDDEKIKYGSFMLSFGSNTCWSFILKSFQDKYELGRTIISNNMMYHFSNTMNCMNEALVAQYFIWLYKAFPYEEEREYQEQHCGFVHTTIDKDNLSHFRNVLLQLIKNNGYYNAIELIKIKIPQLAREKWFNTFEFCIFNNSNSAKLLGYNCSLPNFRMGNNIIVYVESDNDKKFYETIYTKISKNPTKYNFPNDYNFEFKSFGNNGGCNQVKNIVNKSLHQGKINIYGIIDKDGGKNRNEEHILTTTRYSMENYLMDPILILHILSMTPEKRLFKNVDKILKTKYNVSLINIDVNKISENDLIEKYCPILINEICKNQSFITQCIPEISTQNSNYHNQNIKIKYHNGLTINVPRWVSENEGHNVVNVLKKYNQYWNEQFLLAKLQNIDIICIDIIDIFKQIIEKYSYTKTTNNIL